MQANNPPPSSNPAGTTKAQVTSYSVKGDGTVTNLGMKTADIKTTQPPAQTAPNAQARQPSNAAAQPVTHKQPTNAQPAQKQPGSLTAKPAATAQAPTGHAPNTLGKQQTKTAVPAQATPTQTS